MPEGSEWQYKLSAAMSELYLTGRPASTDGVTGIEVSGLLYPSVASDANADNLALNREAADGCLEFVFVHYVEIAKKVESANKYDIKGLDFADTLSDLGEIQWRDAFPSHLVPGTDFRLGMDGDSLALRDSRDILVGRFQA